MRNTAKQKTAQHDVDHHVADADQHLVAEDGKTFFQINPDEAPAPAEMAPEGQQIWMPAAESGEQDHKAGNPLRKHGGQRRAAYAHLRRAQVAENQHPVQEDIGEHAGNRTPQRDPTLSGTAQQGCHGHGKNHQGVGKPGNPEVFDPDSPDMRLVGIHAHDGFRKADGHQAEKNSDSHHTGKRQAVGAVDSVIVLRAEILGKKQHTPAHKAPVSGEHEG